MDGSDPAGTAPIDRLRAVMRRLRDPVQGCAWDREQDFASIAPYTIEEAYEVADAIARGDLADLRDELGDLLLQVVFHAQMAAEQGAFDFDGVAAAISDKLVRRHPHVFGDASAASADAVHAQWEARKADERARKAEADGRRPSLLDGVALGMPAALRAVKLQKRAARVGFDWPEIAQVDAKIDEELAELRAAMASGDPAQIEDELGDTLFALANLARHLGVDPEAALRSTNDKFERRFKAIERLLEAEGTDIATAGLDRLEALWQQVKRAER